MVSRSTGFALVELVLALILLSVGLLGSAGLMIHSQALMRRAEVREWAAQTAQTLVDSLAIVGAIGSGGWNAPEGQVTWSTQNAGGVLRIEIVVASNLEPGADSLVFEAARPLLGAVKLP